MYMYVRVCVSVCLCINVIRFVDRCVIRNSMNRIRFGGIYRYAEVMVHYHSVQQDEMLSHFK